MIALERQVLPTSELPETVWCDYDQLAARERLKQRHAGLPVVVTVKPTAASAPSVVLPGSVPEHLELNDCLRKNAETLRSIPLVPLECKDGAVLEKSPLNFESAMNHEALNAGRSIEDVITVVFVVRRPGCVSCREHGLQLSELIMEFRNVALWAIVKETDVEERGIVSFFKDFFSFPIYKDEQWATYKAMGNRKLNLFKLIRRYLTARRRWLNKGIPNRIDGGDIWLQGGILFFKRGELRYAYEEECGKEFDLSDIRSAITRLQQDEDLTYSETSDGSCSFTSVRTEI
jgi:hypothetical protein